MRMKSIKPIIALIGLGSLGVLGSTTDLAENFFESVKSSPVAKVFLSEDKKESEKNNSISQFKAQNTDISAAGIITATDSPSTEIPDYILYDRMFTLILKFRQLAEEQEARGEQVTAFHGYFERELNLDDWQARILQETAAVYVEAVDLVDAQAEIIIDQLRLQYPAGSISEGQLIQPSPELLQLQEQRNKLALYYRDQVSSLLGNDKFNELDTFVHGRFASGFQPMPLSSIPVSKDKGEAQ